MHIHRSVSRLKNHLCIVTLTFSSLLFSDMLLADSLKEATERFKAELALCGTWRSNQDEATCRLEATHAFAEAKQKKLEDAATTSYEKNAQARCKALRGDEEDACILRMQGEGRVQGSVSEGGILREIVRPLPFLSR